jgi:hypothetical protein
LGDSFDGAVHFTSAWPVTVRVLMPMMLRNLVV